MWSVSHFSVLKNWSCAIKNREPCQVGNQAALSGDFDVPQGSLFGAEGAENAHKITVESEVYDLILCPSGRKGVNACRIARFSPFFFRRTTDTLQKEWLHV